MAIVTAIKEKTQSRTAMKKVMDYVAQDYKTLFQNENGEQCRLLSGQNCCGETAFQEFMTTKKQYRKESKVFFYQYVQSFKPDCGATPQEIHQMGIELARRFEGYEVQIATHIDRDHWHNHLIVNSVSCETGLKLQFNEKDLEQLRTLSDEICLAHGLEILKPYQKPAMKPMGAGEYRSAVRGGSFKFQLMNAIDTALSQSRTQAEFTACMEEMGYGVKWVPQHKYITYTGPTGQRCRDNKLHDEKYLKERMEQHFAQLERTQGFEQAQYSSPAAGSGGVNFLHSDRQHDSQRGMAEYPVQPSGGGATAGDAGGIYLHAPEHRRCEQDDEKLLSERLQRTAHGAGKQNSVGASGDADSPDSGYEFDDQRDGQQDSGRDEEYGADFTSPGYAAVEAQGQLDSRGAALLDSALYLAQSVENLVNPYDPDAERQKYEQERMRRKSSKKKKQKHGYSPQYEQDMEQSM
ncbi:MAG: relaxase/mobilization nuclease domain-containing protein [Lacrimispora sphenoides]